MNKDARRLVYALLGGAISILMGALILAVYLRNGVWLSRCGSLMAAMAAGAVFFQVKRELNIEEQRERLANKKTIHYPKSDQSGPIDMKAEQLRKAKLEADDRLLVSERLILAGWIAIVALVGELCHGFGELLYELILRILNLGVK